MAIKTLGIDLGKRCFHVLVVDENGKVFIKQKLSRTKLIEFLSKPYWF
ncbi:IS110 family transposase [Gynuella sunshinyii]|uniref:Transposase n=1 Tax=Gynuella sunshinyii YC6258 TaxID=1445510 RepID=A0A0C5VI01_9GAMM|nr:IS110 family transposase [Gynuella sunshinyii]AJQ94257.1 hypothetical Protein YC6258_02219 [Gynuella sunshinyii YC6258]